MPTCPNCQENVLQDAIYCENCGVRLDSATPGEGDQAGSARPSTHGSLREEIPLLSGAARQIRARIDGFRERAERERQTARREEQIRKQEEESTRKSHGRNLVGILVGVALLALWIWLLVRGLREHPPHLVQQLMARLAAVELPED